MTNGRLREGDAWTASEILRGMAVAGGPQDDGNEGRRFFEAPRTLISSSPHLAPEGLPTPSSPHHPIA